MTLTSPFLRTSRLALAALLPVATGTSALASDTLTFAVRGSIRPSCGLAADRVRIDLGAVTAAELAGGTSPWRGAAFTGTDCVGVTRATVTLTATPFGPDPRYLAATGTGGGVAIELRTADGAPLPPDGVTSAGFHWPAGNPVLGFQARYVRVGAVRPGGAGASAQIHIRWE
jgi:type 1 fimbria pilin